MTSVHSWNRGQSINHYDISTPRELEALHLRASARVVLRFYRMGCPACDKMAPVWREMVSRPEYRGVTFASADVSGPSELAKQHDIEFIPTFIAFNRGSESDRFSGASTEKLRRLIETGKK
jgi:thioredoxin-like negative regulator of GroEL